MQKIDPVRAGKKKAVAQPVSLSETTRECSETEPNQIYESCRVEELMPKFLKPKPLDPKLFEKQVKHPAPEYSETEKQIYSYLKGVPISQINNHQMQEWQIVQRYDSIQDEWGHPVPRKRYWGELQDASSVYQLERDRLVLAKYEH